MFNNTKARFWYRLTGWILALLALALLGGCAWDGKQSTMDPKGPLAAMQKDLFMVTVYVSTAIFAVVGGLLVWVVWHFREKPEDKGKPFKKHKDHGNPLIELGLIGASIGLLVIIAVPTLEGIWMMHELPTDRPDYPDSQLVNWYPEALPEEMQEDVLEVTVRGWQWWFNFEYPQFNIESGNELVIPAGKVVKLNLRAADVIHSFWLPKVAGKVDLMPGRANWMWIQADEPGHYYGQCAEYCGESHAYMLFRADALPEDEFIEWVQMKQRGPAAPGGFKAEPTEDIPEPSLADDWTAWHALADSGNIPDEPVHRGAAVFFGKANCNACHYIDNARGSPIGKIGPELSFLGTRHSIAAGFMDHANEDGSIDREKQYDNILRWVHERNDEYTEIKPGNHMFYAKKNMDPTFMSVSSNMQGHYDKLRADGNAMTDQEYRDLATFLQSLQ